MIDPARMEAIGLRIALTRAGAREQKLRVALEQIANLPPGAVGHAGVIARAALADGAVPACPAVPGGGLGTAENTP